MSSVSFPSGSQQGDFFPYSQGQAAFDQDDVTLPNPHPAHGGFSGFQVNPLSPRTPRTSMMSSTTTSSYVPMTASISQRTPTVSSHGDARTAAQELMIKEEDLNSSVDIRTGAVATPPIVRAEEVWREIVKTSNGRDKALKLVQYSLRICTLLHSSVDSSTLLRKPRVKAAWEADLLSRTESTISGLSLARKCMIMFNWLQPLTTITRQQPVEELTGMPNKFGKKSAQERPPLLHRFLHAPPPVLLELLNGFADDLATLSKLGLVGKGVGNRAGRIADWCWFVGTIIALIELALERSVLKGMMREVETRLYRASLAGPGSISAATEADDRELAKLRKQDYWLQISRAKLIMDLIFVSYDVFKLKRGREPARAFTGLMSAVLSSTKLYDSHRQSLLRASEL